MKPMAEPLCPHELQDSLDRLEPLFSARGGQVDVCVFDANSDERLLYEVGRLRELCFRGIGGGSGEGVDLDDDDFGPGAYQQLVVVDRAAGLLVGGCRFAVASRRQGRPLATEAMFAFADDFEREHRDGLLDIGRMFVVPDARAKRTSALSLDYLFRGVGQVALSDDVKHFFGRVVFEKDFDPFLRDLTLAYLRHHFGHGAPWVRAKHPEPLRRTTEPFGVTFSGDAKKDLRGILQVARRRGGTIPALVRAYVAMSPQLRVFDSARDEDIGGVEEVCMMVDKAHILPRREQRWLKSKKPQSNEPQSNEPQPNEPQPDGQQMAAC